MCPLLSAPSSEAEGCVEAEAEARYVLYGEGREEGLEEGAEGDVEEGEEVKHNAI